MSGNEDDGKRVASFHHFNLQVEPVHAAHFDVKEQDSRHRRLVVHEKCFRTRIGMRPPAFNLEHERERFADFRVVVDNADQGLFLEVFDVFGEHRVLKPR